MEKKELIKAIKAIRPGLMKDTNVELSEFINFNDSEIVSCNNIVSISYPYETGLTGAVKGFEFLQILEKMPANIDIRNRKDKLIISKKTETSKIKFSLNVLEMQQDTWPKMPENFVKLPSNFIEALTCLIIVVFLLE